MVELNLLADFGEAFFPIVFARQRVGVSAPEFFRHLALRHLQPQLRRCIFAGMAAITETYRYITKTPGVRGGNARIESSRIGVHDIIALLQNGETVDTVPQSFPGITRAQVYECLAYYEDHRAEIDHLVASQMAEAGA
jgi:uncharacterized protein (DUF433 family)